jgi:hypothetical protein
MIRSRGRGSRRRAVRDSVTALAFSPIATVLADHKTAANNGISPLSLAIVGAPRNRGLSRAVIVRSMVRRLPVDPPSTLPLDAPALSRLACANPVSQ